jgi:hypothetical protein
MFYVTLNKIESTHNNLRTDVVTGLTPRLPVVGEQFFMYSNEVLTENTNTRFIRTSKIESIKASDDGREIIFRTQNSLYTLTSIEPTSSAPILHEEEHY